ncbi:MAG: hypothetical protein JO128_12755 [Alphaproteobacteria bacterium]|nr:hypothetical protein [Alphaproteobacteria bacterium]
MGGPLAQLPGLAINRFVSSLSQLSWFAAVGEPLTEGDIDDARDYLQLLGFADAEVRATPDWHTAETITRSPNWNSAWWDAEEKRRRELLEPLIAEWSEHTIMSSLTRVTTEATRVTLGAASIAAARREVADPALTRVAAGAATQACYQSMLAEIAGVEGDHPFYAKFRLFAAGRWPLGLVGTVFHVF